jgi:peptidyl-prolyl cis-trans isomerase D
MAKNPRKSQAPLSKKHMDRLHRERMQTRWIMIGAITVLVLVVAIIVYGVLEQNYFRFTRTVATVNGENISGTDFRAFTRYYRNNLIQSAENTFQLASMFGSDPNAMQSFGSQLVSISDQLDGFQAGQAALDQLINDKLIRQEAKKRGITVTSQEVETGMQEAFRFYANGTPTPTATIEPKPTATLSQTQLAMVPPTATPTSIPSPTATQVITATTSTTPTSEATPTSEPTLSSTPVITQTATPTPSPTPYTLQEYQSNYATMVVNLATLQIPETVLRYVVESRIYQDKLMKQVVDEKAACTQDEVWAQHILVPDQATAEKVYNLATSGGDWFQLASEYSTDTSNKDKGGDLGWFGPGQMVAEFEKAAFALNTPGEISQPVKTQFGWHIIRLVAKQSKQLTGSDCTNAQQQKFQEWVTQQRSTAKIDINSEAWHAIVPLQPTMPADVQQAVDGLRSQMQQQQPQVPVITPSP